MGFLICCARLLLLQLLLLTTATPPVAAQPPPPPQPSSAARALDAALQDYAFRALSARPRTGIVYNATVPGNLTGMAASALRLRSGSLRRRGFAGYFQFALPPGVVVQPHVHDLGNLSDRYYPPPAGYAYLAPVLGLLVYDAANLSAVGVGLPELSIVASGGPISVAFDGVRAVPAGGAAPRCVVFDLNGVPQFRDLEGTNACTTYHHVLFYAENVWAVFEENSADEQHHPVLSRPESLMVSLCEQSLPKSSNFHNASKSYASASDLASRV